MASSRVSELYLVLASSPTVVPARSLRRGASENAPGVGPFEAPVGSTSTEPMDFPPVAAADRDTGILAFNRSSPEPGPRPDPPMARDDRPEAADPRSRSGLPAASRVDRLWLERWLSSWRVTSIRRSAAP